MIAGSKKYLTDVRRVERQLGAEDVEVGGEGFGFKARRKAVEEESFPTLDRRHCNCYGGYFG